MTLLPVLIAALAASMAPCSPPLGGRPHYVIPGALREVTYHDQLTLDAYAPAGEPRPAAIIDRKSTRLNSSHLVISYAVFCLKKKNIQSTRNNIEPTSGRISVIDYTVNVHLPSHKD